MARAARDYAAPPCHDAFGINRLQDTSVATTGVPGTTIATGATRPTDIWLDRLGIRSIVTMSLAGALGAHRDRSGARRMGRPAGKTAGTKLTPPIRRSYATPKNAMRKCARKTAAARTGKEMEMTTLMTTLTRRSVLRTSLGAAAAGTLARPHIANAAATTASGWWQQGFAEGGGGA